MAVAVTMAAGCGRRGRGGALRRHDSRCREHSPQGADGLLTGLAQGLQGGAARRIDVEGDRDMTAAGGDAAHHAGRHHILAGCRVDDGLQDAAHGRFGDFCHGRSLPLAQHTGQYSVAA